MNPALRLCLMAITIVNLAFVHATDAASLWWLGPMYAVAVFSGRLARLERFRAYRWAWNLAVIGIFAVLVQNTAVAGPRYLLEDGLRLAAVCQVHLLCNLGARQKPDLLFFNSFLIAVVTAFLTQDVLYSAVFLAYAPLFVVGLSLYAAERAGPEAARTIARDALLRAGLALAGTLVVFVACPRDFHRKGLVVESLAKNPAGSALDIGFTEEVRLDREGDAGTSDRVVARVRLVRGNVLDVPPYFRGATELVFDGERWDGGPPNQLGDARWTPSSGRRLERAVPGEGPVVAVDLEDTTSSRLFAPLAVKSVEMLEDAPAASARSDGTLRFGGRSQARQGSAFRYELALGDVSPRPGGPVAKPVPASLAAAVDLSLCPPMPETTRIAEDVRKSLPAGVAQHVLVEAMRVRLASRTDYLAPGAQGAALDVESFSAGRGGGHCEHFATALAVMLRRVGVPCRLATGYLSDEWDGNGTVLTIRRRHAHAWVEVKDPTAGWMTVDATPASARSAAAGASVFAKMKAWFASAWSKVVFFDADGRAAVAAWIKALPGRVADVLRENSIVSALAVAAAIAGAVVLRRRRAMRTPAAVRAYRACLRRIRIEPRTGETPREFLDRVAATGVVREDVERLRAATQAHEAARFAG